MRLPSTPGEAPLGPGGAETWRSELRSSCTGSWPSLDSNYLGHMVCMRVCVYMCVCVSLYVSACLHVSIYESVFSCVQTHILSFLYASVYLFDFAQAAFDAFN